MDATLNSCEYCARFKCKHFNYSYILTSYYALVICTQFIYSFSSGMYAFLLGENMTYMGQITSSKYIGSLNLTAITIIYSEHAKVSCDLCNL